MQVQQATREEWAAFLARCSRVNLLQTWEYGEAKRIEGWDVERVLLGPGPDAAVQILNRRLPVVGKVARVNRGPLVSASAEHDHDVWAETLAWIRSELVTRRGGILSIAPELSAGAPAVQVLRQGGFAPPKRAGWTSALVDLACDEAALREALEKKWRNCLSKSERSGLNVEEEQSKKAMVDFLDRYVPFRESRGFRGPAEQLIAALADCLGSVTLKVFTARLGPEAASGIVVAVHANTATYLLSWNSPDGRRVSASYLLIWAAIKSLQREGVRWFDVGGLDAEVLPGVTEFKLGLRPTPYTLVGECWAYPTTVRGWLGRAGRAANEVRSALTSWRSRRTRHAAASAR